MHVLVGKIGLCVYMSHLVCVCLGGDNILRVICYDNDFCIECPCTGCLNDMKRISLCCLFTGHVQ